MRDADQEDEVGHEEADAEVQVDGGASPLNGSAELKGQDAQDQTHQGNNEADLRHHFQFIYGLEEKKD